MAINNPQNADPLVQLTAEARDNIDKMKASLEKADGDMDALEELGIDVSRLREKVAWGKKAREVILKRLG